MDILRQSLLLNQKQCLLCFVVKAAAFPGFRELSRVQTIGGSLIINYVFFPKIARTVPKIHIVKGLILYFAKNTVPV